MVIQRLGQINVVAKDLVKGILDSFAIIKAQDLKDVGIFQINRIPNEALIEGNRQVKIVIIVFEDSS